MIAYVVPWLCLSIAGGVLAFGSQYIENDFWRGYCAACLAIVFSTTVAVFMHNYSLIQKLMKFRHGR